MDMKSLYEQMLLSYIDLPPLAGETLASLVERIRQIRKYRRELKVLEAKMNSEKQFNRKVELNAKVWEIMNTLTVNR